MHMNKHGGSREMEWISIYLVFPKQKKGLQGCNLMNEYDATKPQLTPET